MHLLRREHALVVAAGQFLGGRLGPFTHLVEERDCSGDGDTVVLTKSLDVKGSTLNAKMGTAVRNIRLVPNNTEQIEGRVDGQLIVILTKYVKKQA